MKNVLTIALAIIIVILSSCQEKQNNYQGPVEDKLASSRIDSIFQNPAKYVDESINVEGIITQFVPATTRSTSFYLLKSYYGSIIRVITSSQSPLVNYRYKVDGVVSMQPSGPVIVEKSKVCLNCEMKIVESTSVWERILPFLLIGIALVLLLIIIIVLMLNKQKKSSELFHEKSSFTKGETKEHDLSFEAKEMKYDESFKTLKIPVYSDSSETLKIIRVGKLQVQAGPDSGKIFPLTGIQTADGVVLSFGRDTKDWKDYLISKNFFTQERLHSHILVSDPTSTLSRLQAELIYNDRMFIRHHGSNPTTVNGTDIPKDKLVELSIGSTIQAGAMVLKYIE